MAFLYILAGPIKRIVAASLLSVVPFFVVSVLARDRFGDGALWIWNVAECSTKGRVLPNCNIRSIIK